MNISLVTTTVYVPHALKLFRALDSNIPFFVIGDTKTPSEAETLCASISNCAYYSVERQKALGYKCSELIGWASIQRRNIGALEALKAGAEAVVFWDTDNIPLDYYFDSFDTGFGYPHNGLVVSGCGMSFSRWFDPGSLLIPNAKHRGFPHIRKQPFYVEPIVNAKIGVVAGLCLGDPDIDAITRMEHHPSVHQVSELARAGVVVNPDTTTVFNSQNTAFLRQLAPAMFMLPGVGRYDDIYASLICQRVMRDLGLHVRFGPPFVWQQRNQHNLIGDLRQEIDGMEHVVEFAAWLDRRTVVSDLLSWLRPVYVMAKNFMLPAASVEAALAYLDDIETVL